MDLDLLPQEDDIQHKQPYSGDGSLCYQDLMRERTQWERVRGLVKGGAHWRGGDLETNQGRTKGEWS